MNEIREYEVWIAPSAGSLHTRIVTVTATSERAAHRAVTATLTGGDFVRGVVEVDLAAPDATDHPVPPVVAVPGCPYCAPDERCALHLDQEDGADLRNGDRVTLTADAYLRWFDLGGSGTVTYVWPDGTVTVIFDQFRGERSVAKTLPRHDLQRSIR